MRILASQKGSKKTISQLHFYYLLFELCLPLLVLFSLLVSSSSRLPPVFLYMQIYVSPLCRLSRAHRLPAPPGPWESFTLSDRGHRVCRSQLNTDRLCCPLPSTTSPISNTTRAIPRPNCVCSVEFHDNFFLLRQISFHSVPPPSILSLVGTKVVFSTFC